MRNNQFNILMVANFSIGTGYAWDMIEDYFIALGNYFISKGCSAIICYPKVTYCPNKFIDNDIEVKEFDFYKESLLNLYKFIRENRIRVFYLIDRPTYSIKYLVCKIAGGKVIITHDHTSGKRDRPCLCKRLMKIGMNSSVFSASYSIAISNFVKKRLVTINCFPQSRITTIYNGVYPHKYENTGSKYVYNRYSIPDKKKIIFSFARACKYKGIATLIEAAEILVIQKGRNDLFFLFTGDGPDIEYFKKLIHRKKLQKNFLCPGKSDQIKQILQEIEISVVPSLWEEGFGLSVIESMASGKPVIASKVGGMAEIINDGLDGYYFKKGDSAELAIRIELLADNKELRRSIGKAARETVKNKYNFSNKKRELTKLFDRLCFQNA